MYVEAIVIVAISAVALIAYRVRVNGPFEATHYVWFRGLGLLCDKNGGFDFVKKQRGSRTNHSATILIPCRNEKGNIRQAIDRIPNFASAQQIIFVDGHSTDGTREEIEQVIAENPEKDMEVWTQPGRGKGDAVRYGFAKAHNDILMILDADLTVPYDRRVVASMNIDKVRFADTPGDLTIRKGLVPQQPFAGLG